MLCLADLPFYISQLTRSAFRNSRPACFTKRSPSEILHGENQRFQPRNSPRRKSEISTAKFSTEEIIDFNRRILHRENHRFQQRNSPRGNHRFQPQKSPQRKSEISTAKFSTEKIIDFNRRSLHRENQRFQQRNSPRSGS